MVKTAYAVLALIPLSFASSLGGVIASMVGPWLPRTKVARKNIRRAMPDLSDMEVERIIRDMWNNIGRTFAEYPHIAGMDDQQIRQLVEFEGIEHVRNTSQVTCGSLFFTAHLGNWEFAPRLFSGHGYPLYIVYRRSNNPGLNKLIHMLRNQYLAGSIPKGQQGSRQMIEVLLQGGRVGMLLDQKMNDGIKVNFLGTEAMTAPAIARLALRYGCPILPVRVIRTDGVRHKVIVYPPVPLTNTGNLHDDVHEIMSRINAIMESWIREYPGQWFWLHNRWPDD